MDHGRVSAHLTACLPYQILKELLPPLTKLFGPIRGMSLFMKTWDASEKEKENHFSVLVQVKYVFYSTGKIRVVLEPGDYLIWKIKV